MGGIVLIVEPGTSVGFPLIQSVAKLLAPTEHLIAPYIHNTFVESASYWIHFAQKFTRPEFQRMIRQKFRESTLMASDWEETTYSYVAYGNIEQEYKPWARAIGRATKYKGYLTIPLLTQEGIREQKIMKRHKEAYALMKNLRWGDTIETYVDCD
jgi:ribosomal protein RSM22 (predicted rRNA methylase)